MKKTVFLLLLTGLLFACKNNKKEKGAASRDAQIDTILIASKDLQTCKDRECPDIDVQYLKIDGNTNFSRAVNEKNEKDLATIFNLDQESKPAETITKALNDFVESYFQFRSDYPQASAGYEATASQIVKSSNEKTFVLRTSYYIFTGGAHGYGGVHFLNFDAQTGQYLSPEDLIANKPAFTDFAEKKFRQHYHIPPDVDINSKGFFFKDGKFALPENIAVTDKQVILLYNPYEAASYAEGQLRFVFPKKTVAQWLNY